MTEAFLERITSLIYSDLSQGKRRLNAHWDIFVCGGDINYKNSELKTQQRQLHCVHKETRLMNQEFCYFLVSYQFQLLRNTLPLCVSPL